MRHFDVFLTVLNLVILFTACNAEKQNNITSEKETNESVDSDTIGDWEKKDTSLTNEYKSIPVDTLEARLIGHGLVDIQSINPSILVDLKYASENNFMEKNVYGSLQKVYLQPEVAERLDKVQKALNEIDSSLTLLVYDGVRPVWVQQYMWDHLDMPLNEKTKFVSNPKNGSLHNYGCAVDITIADENGIPLDMGAGYDDVRKIAYPSMEDHFIKTGELTQDQLENRRLLRKVMKVGGFWNIQTEWWHFNAYNRSKAKELFDPVL